MKGPYRSRSRLVLDLLAAIQAEGPAGVTRLLVLANLTHEKFGELIGSFEAKGWVRGARVGERAEWTLTDEGRRVLAELRRIDAAMQDYGLGL